MNDWIMPVLTLVAIIVGPIAAVVVSDYRETRKAKRKAKQDLFLALMAHRRSLHPEWIAGLNTVDVIFFDVPDVIQAWRTLFDLLHSSEVNPHTDDKIRHAILDLLHEMASHLGYPRLRQTTLDRLYSPRGQGEFEQRNNEIQAEWLRVLKATANLNVTAISDVCIDTHSIDEAGPTASPSRRSQKK